MKRRTSRRRLLPRHATPLGRAADRWLDLAPKDRRELLSYLADQAAHLEAFEPASAYQAAVNRAVVAVLRAMRRGLR